ncbi:hypothetical protein ACV334_33765, partial [Pseudomonas aeruginosa]
QWRVMLFGDDGVSFQLLAQKAGRESRGHGFDNPEIVRIYRAAGYRDDPRGAGVLAVYAEQGPGPPGMLPGWKYA